MKFYNISNDVPHGLTDNMHLSGEICPDEDYQLYGGKATESESGVRMTGAQNDALWAFLSSFIITLILVSLAAGLLYVDKSAREASGVYENIEAQAELMRLLDRLSALRWTVRGFFPYFILAVELLLLLCRLFSVIAKAIF